MVACQYQVEILWLLMNQGADGAQSSWGLSTYFTKVKDGVADLYEFASRVNFVGIILWHGFYDDRDCMIWV